MVPRCARIWHNTSTSRELKTDTGQFLERSAVLNLFNETPCGARMILIFGNTKVEAVEPLGVVVWL